MASNVMKTCKKCGAVYSGTHKCPVKSACAAFALPRLQKLASEKAALVGDYGDWWKDALMGRMFGLRKLTYPKSVLDNSGFGGGESTKDFDPENVKPTTGASNIAARRQLATRAYR